MSKVKNRIRPGNILVSDSERAIIIEYEQESYELNEDGSVGQSLGKSQGNKKLKVKSLTADTNIDMLATEMMEKCKLIKPSALSVLKGALEKLKSREATASVVDAEDSRQSSGAVKEKQSEASGIPAAGKVESDKHDSGGAKHEYVKPKKSRREKISSTGCSCISHAW